MFEIIPQEILHCILDVAFDVSETQRDWKSLFLVCKRWNNMMKEILPKKKTRSVVHEFIVEEFDNDDDLDIIDFVKDLELDPVDVEHIKVGDVVDTYGYRGLGYWFCFEHGKGIKHEDEYGYTTPQIAYPFIRKFGLNFFKDIGEAVYFGIPTDYKVLKKLSDGTIVNMEYKPLAFVSEKLIQEESCTVLVYSRGEDSKPDTYYNVYCIDNA